VLVIENLQSADFIVSYRKENIVVRKEKREHNNTDARKQK